MFCTCLVAPEVHAKCEDLELVPEDLSNRSTSTGECDSDSLPDGEEVPHAPHQSAVTRPHFVSHAAVLSPAGRELSLQAVMGSAMSPVQHRQVSFGLPSA